MANIENDNEHETVIVEGEIWAVMTTPDSDSDLSATAEELSQNEADEHLAAPLSEPDAAQTPSGRTDQEPPLLPSTVTSVPQESDEDEFDPLEAITKLLVGGVIEGTSQLTQRLRAYEAALREEAEGEVTQTLPEDELVRLRYAVVGFIFDAQATFRRNLGLWAKIADQSARATNRVTQPVTDSFLFRPVRRRFDGLVKRGEESLARWIADGRRQEQPSRNLARRTYAEIVDEFIDRLSENPELQDLITQQSIGMASEVRDEVRERTVTGDNLVEGLVRRLLRRTPREELPGPPPEVQRWAGLTLEEYRAQMNVDERTDKSP